ncbi:hypothetical protein GGR56DRAFT_676875 [Xylariaceae sp. FL0804]|nr:hypothetical protein GGR56DRAFT_676875 [Xylariaceae sp. FL0804]
MAASLKTVEQGAATAVWAATAAGTPRPLTDEGYAPWAYDVKGEDRLWALSQKLTGVVVAA